MRKNRIQYFTIFIGCLLAMVIVCSNVLAYHVKDQAKAKTEKSDESQSENQVVISMPTFSLPSPVHVEMKLDFHCLFEILFEEDREHNDASDFPSASRKLLVTLFQVIISPNAP